MPQYELDEETRKDPCGCEESVELTQALYKIVEGRKEFEQREGIQWDYMFEPICDAEKILEAYEKARKEQYGR